MDPLTLFAASRLLVVAGKGGVGKTTVTAVVAVAAARQDRRVLVLELDQGGGLGPLLGHDGPLRYEPTTLREGLGPTGAGRIDARLLVPGEALRDYLDEKGLGRVTGRLVRAGVMDVVATAAPGIDDILVLGKVKQLERAGTHDLVILDAPAAGHAVTFLRSASGLADAVQVGPVATQARDVLELLRDEARCQVILVTLPEETPVNEVVETAFTLEEDVGVHLGPLVVNGVLPPVPGLTADPPAGAGRARAALAAAARFRLARLAQQDEQLHRLAERLPLPRVVLPFRFAAGLGPDDVDALADALLAAAVER